MTADETARLLLILTEAYRADMTETEIDIWTAAVAGFDFQLAGQAAVRVIKASEFFPSVSTFLEAINAERRARAVARQPSPPARHGVTEAGRALIAEARANLHRVKDAKR